MAPPPVSKEEKARREAAIERFLQMGHPPPGVRGNKTPAVFMAATELGDVSDTTLRQQLREKKLTPDLSKYQEPDDLKVTGRSTLYDQDGNPIMEWVKTGLDKDRREVLFREAIAAMRDQVPRIKSTPGPKCVAGDLMAFYPVGDHHMGMLAWHEETGADYDLTIAEELLRSAFDHLICAVGPCDTAVVAVMGDFLHYDSFESVTPQNKNQLDSDTRYPKMVRAAVRAMRYVVDLARKRHSSVIVIFEPGNHDPASTVWLAELFSVLYENEPRVTVDTSPRHFHYVAFGKTLIGTHHGDTAKMDALPLMMATDMPKEWGGSQFRYWWTGHVHKDTVKDIQGCRVESVRVLPPVDAWAAKQFRSVREMKAVVYHKEYGEVERHTFNPAMLDAV